MFSIRKYLLTNATLSFSYNLQQMIVLRTVQGFTGGTLIPLAFTLIITLLPKAKQPMGLALFAVSATFANWGWDTSSILTSCRAR